MASVAVVKSDVLLAEVNIGIVLLATEVDSGSVVWEAAIISNCDGIGGSNDVWRATNIISNSTMWVAEGGNGCDSVYRVAYASGNIVMRLANGGDIII